MRNFVNPTDLIGGEFVSWEHPETGKVYDFVVTAIDRRSQSQPAKIELITAMEEDEEIIVDSLVKLYKWVDGCWPYRDVDHLIESGYAVKDTPTLTMDKLFYTDIKSGESYE